MATRNRRDDRLPPEAWLVIAVIIGLGALAAWFGVPELLQ